MFFVTLVLALGLAMSAAAKNYTIGFAQTGGNEGAWRMRDRLVNAAAKDMGITLKFVDGQEGRRTRLLPSAPLSPRKSTAFSSFPSLLPVGTMFSRNARMRRSR